jgi:hypothetical protein
MTQVTQIELVENWLDGLYKKLQEKCKIEKIMSINFVSSPLSSHYFLLKTMTEPTMKRFHRSTIAISDWKMMLLLTAV